MNKEQRKLFAGLKNEASKINSTECLELIQKLQTAFDCAEHSFDNGLAKQSRKIDSLTARVRNILPRSCWTDKLESERRYIQCQKDFKPKESMCYGNPEGIDLSLCWCSEDD